MLDIVNNLYKIVLDPSFTLDKQGQLVEDTEKSSFLDLVKTVEKIFEEKKGEIDFSKEQEEYSCGRIFTRLERIAEKKYHLEREQVYPLVENFACSMKQKLVCDIPEARFARAKREEGISYSEEASDYFYQELQEKIQSCNLHTANNYFGQARLCLSDFTLDSDASGIPNLTLHIALQQNFKTLSTHEVLSLQEDRLFVSNGRHGFALRKDEQGKWWKVDSLYKVGVEAYQIPITLESVTPLFCKVIVDEKEIVKSSIQKALSNLASFKEVIQSIPDNMSSEDYQRCIGARNTFLVGYYLRSEEYYFSHPKDKEFLVGLDKDFRALFSGIKPLSTNENKKEALQAILSKIQEVGEKIKAFEEAPCSPIFKKIKTK